MNCHVRPPSVDFQVPESSGSGGWLPPPRPPPPPPPPPPWPRPAGGFGASLALASVVTLSGPTSICAYVTRGLERPMSSAIRPIAPLGRPLPLTRVHVSPPFSERHMPLPGPPPAKPHDVRRRWYVAANRVFGFDGSITRSV